MNRIKKLVEAMNEAEMVEFIAPGFPGFYESVFTPDCTEDDLFNDPAKVDDDIITWVIDNATLPDSYYNEVGESYIDALESEIKNVIPNAHMEFKEIDSPKFYNYSTDDCVGLINWSDIVGDVKKYLEDNKEAFAKLVKDKHSSYSGFISFYSNDASEWDIENADHNEISTILQFILMNENENVFDDIIMITVEDNYPQWEVDMDELKEQFNFDVEPESMEDLEYYVKEGDTYKWVKDAPGQQKLALESKQAKRSLKDRISESRKK